MNTQMGSNKGDHLSTSELVQKAPIEVAIIFRVDIDEINPKFFFRILLKEPAIMNEPFVGNDYNF